MHGRDRPPWLKPIIATSHAFVVNPDDSNGRLLIRSIVDHYPSIKPIAVDGDGIQPLDFDRIFAESRDSGELPHLFDELIALAEKIIQSGEIESLTALSALKYLIRTLEENRNGSYLAVSQSISLAAYFKNLLDVYLEKIPGIAEHREAYARTVRQAEQELQKTKQEIRDKISEEVRERLPKLGRLAEIAEQIDVLLPPASLPAPSPATDETDIGDQ
ncbi:MAG: hypothetical protein CMJ58_16890 [Planctomycetaceae bacterium]|nr:hypothetical protein [Planctomycetaceae bacterium]